MGFEPTSPVPRACEGAGNPRPLDDGHHEQDRDGERSNATEIRRGRARSVPDGAGTHGHSRNVRGKPSESQAQVERAHLVDERLLSSAYEAEVGGSRPSVPTAVCISALIRDYFTVTCAAPTRKRKTHWSRACSGSIPTKSFARRANSRCRPRAERSSCSANFREVINQSGNVACSFGVRPHAGRGGA